MAILCPSLSIKTCNNIHVFSNTKTISSSTSSTYFWYPPINLNYTIKRFSSIKTSSYRLSSGFDDEEERSLDCSFGEAVKLFNGRDYYTCHDFLESLWNESQDPTRRTLLHGILQCAVSFHHLFNQNHKGAMIELGEGLCKLRKLNLERGPFHQFEKHISAALDFIYHTQLELAACTDEFCLALDQSERSYKLLGGYGAGERLYDIENDSDGIMYIVFCPDRSYGTNGDRPRVKLPILEASEEDLAEIDSIC